MSTMTYFLFRIVLWQLVSLKRPDLNHLRPPGEDLQPGPQAHYRRKAPQYPLHPQTDLIKQCWDQTC
jgi:hypothetical protein